MNSRVRAFVFGNYAWLIPLGLVVVVGLLIGISKPENLPTNIIAAIGVALSLIYFIQKQSLEELQVFEDLFTRFNANYGALHQELQGIASCQTPLTAQQHEVLDRYFNLCAEEYLFFQQGCILPLVWRSWCRGMLWYLSCEAIFSAFLHEVGSDSHYGLSLPAIEHGAGMRREQVDRGVTVRPTVN